MATQAATHRAKRRRAVARAAQWVLLLAVAALIATRARELDWRAVAHGVASYDTSALAIALLLAVPAYLAVASYDLVGRRCTGHRLPVRRVMVLSFIGYSFSLNLGAAIGGLAFRYWLYAPYRLAPIAIAQVIALTVLTNWLGYLVAAGALLVGSPPELPGAWQTPVSLLRAIGVGLLLAAALYLVLCARRGGQRVRWRRTALELPGLRMAGVQLVLSLANWCGQGAIITWLMPDGTSWFSVMSALLSSAIAGVLTHIPGGIGVLEGVFVALLGDRASHAEIVAALLLFRATYYIVPFALALIACALLEGTARGRRLRRLSL